MRRVHVLGAVVAALAIAAPAGASDSYAPGTTLLVSRSTGLGALPAQADGNSWSGERAISANGRFTVFRSDADDLGLAVNRYHAYVRDDQTGAVTLLDRAGPGGPVANSTPSEVSISGDGSKACFSSYADNLVPGVGTNHVYVVTIATGTVIAVDRATGGAIADKTSYGCSLDGNGDAVAFASDATNLGGGGGGMRHVYVRHLNTAVTQLVDSYQGVPGDGYAGAPSIDESGQTVAFATSATNLNGPSGDQNGKQDVYARFLGATQPVLVSRATGGGSAIGNGHSSQPSISADGQLVAFESGASNLGDGDADVATDVHVRNLLATTTTLVSRAEGAGGAKSNDDSYSPEIASDGSAVAFLSHANNLGADPGHDEEGPKWLAYVRTLASAHTTIVSRASGASGALDEGTPGHVSLDQHAANAIFDDGAPGLDPLASGAFDEVFQRHLGGNFETRLISRPADGSSRPPQVGPVDSGTRAISADGRFVVFSTPAPLDGPGGTGEVYVRDVLLATTRLVSRANGADGAPANADSDVPAISADGTKVAFASSATNLVAGVNGGEDEIYVRDLAANTTTLVSTGPSGPGNSDSQDVALSQDGSRIAFRSYATNLVTGDANNAVDIFVRDLVAGTTVDASLTVAGGEPDDDAEQPAISADGTRAAWVTDASNIGAGAPGGSDHVYVRDLAAGMTMLVDRAADGSPSPASVGNGMSMSADGNRFVFATVAKLTPGATNTQSDVYVRDVAAGTTILASVAPDGTEPTSQAGSANISLDGSKVTFFTRAPNFPGPTDRGAEWMRDLAAGTTTLLSAHDDSQAPADDGGWAASPNADGSCTVFQSADATLASPSYAGHDFEQLWMRVVARECPIQAPDTTLTSGPNGSAKVRTAFSVFGFKADESSVTFACSLDDAPAKPCGDTFATPALRDGVHRFSVTATDRAGNTDPTPALVTFTVGVPPRVTKLRLVHGRLVFKLSEKAKVRVRLVRTGRAHSAAVGKLTIKRSFKAGTRRVKLPMRRLRKGHYRATVTATDAGGNRSVPKSKSFNVTSAG